MEYADRKEHGHLFKWDTEEGCWETSAGKKVRVIPPAEGSTTWRVQVSSTGFKREVTKEEGGEKKAFLLADIYSKQQAVAPRPRSASSLPK